MGGAAAPPCQEGGAFSRAPCEKALGAKIKPGQYKVDSYGRLVDHACLNRSGKICRAKT
jgi:hypothetical protein